MKPAMNLDPAHRPIREQTTCRTPQPIHPAGSRGPGHRCVRRDRSRSRSCNGSSGRTSHHPLWAQRSRSRGSSRRDPWPGLDTAGRPFLTRGRDRPLDAGRGLGRSDPWSGQQRRRPDEGPARWRPARLPDCMGTGSPGQPPGSRRSLPLRDPALQATRRRPHHQHCQPRGPARVCPGLHAAWRVQGCADQRDEVACPQLRRTGRNLDRDNARLGERRNGRRLHQQARAGSRSRRRPDTSHGRPRRAGRTRRVPSSAVAALDQRCDPGCERRKLHPLERKAAPSIAPSIGHGATRSLVRRPASNMVGPEPMARCRPGARL